MTEESKIPLLAYFWLWYFEARAALQEYEESRGLDGLDRAIDRFNDLIGHESFLTADADRRAHVLAMKAYALLRRYLERSVADDLDAAIQGWEAALDLAAEANPERLEYLHNLVPALVDRYNRDRSRADLERAIACANTVVGATSPGTPARAATLSNAGTAMWHLAVLDHDLDRLDDAIGMLAEAVSTDGVAPDRDAQLHNNLGMGHHTRYDIRGMESDLTASIDAFRIAVGEAPTGFADVPGFLTNLGTMLRHRFERTGVLADLDDAIDVLERASTMAPEGWHGLPTCLANLAGALTHRAVLGGPRELVVRSVLTAARALQLTPETSTEAPRFWSILTNAYSEHARRTGSLDDLNFVIEGSTTAFEGAVSSRDRAFYAANLADQLRWRADMYAESDVPPGAREDDLRRALTLIQSSLAQTDQASQLFPMRLHILASILRRVVASPALGPTVPGAAELAVNNYRVACQLSIAVDVGGALSIGREWAEWAEARGEWPEAAEAYGAALAAADRLFTTQVLREDKESILRVAASVPARAAFAYARSGDAASAVLAIERGRARLLAQALERDRADLDGLRSVGRGDLVERFEAAIRRLGALAALASGLPSPDVVPTDRMRGDYLASALAEHADTLRSIREVAGYEDFLRLPELDDLADPRRPLIYLAATPAGGLALILTSAADVVSIELPELTDAAVKRRVEALQTAHDRRRQSPALWRGTVDAVTRWLWSAAMETVLTATRGAEEIALVPAGLVGMLPLHAAWTPDPGKPTGRRYALDGPAISYAPNGVSLHAAATLAERQPTGSLLAVADPGHSGTTPLPLARVEIDVAQAAVAGTRLAGQAATFNAVTDALEDHMVAHFACHGVALVQSPLDSAVLLAADDRLSLRTLLDLRLATVPRHGLRLVVLSACETQLAGTVLPDEVVSLPAGFLQAGAAGVLASQWALSGMAATLLAVEFYRRIRSGLDGLAALAGAQRWLRDATNGELAALLDPRDPQVDLDPTVLRRLWRGLVGRPPQHRSFALPSEWAAMTYNGY